MKPNGIVLPDRPPHIEGMNPPYQIGDRINVTCTSGPSKPAVQLKWIINGIDVAPDFEIRYPQIRHSGGLQSTKIGLEFELDPSQFWQSEMQLRCMASIAQVYSSNSEELVIGDRGTDIVPYHISHTAPGQHGPNIKGNLPWYDVGDIVDVNCSTVYPAELTWYVNDYEAQPDYVIKYPVRKKPNEPDMSVLGLKMRIEHYHFRSDELRLKCTATQYKMITSSSEKILRSGNQQNSGFHAIENTGSGSYYRHIRWWALQTLVMTMIKLSSSVYH
ncbi:uncharacterized protein LOC111616274 [Centruroides sculpturatus]|uniref:uncharacterized protein LOC111616274 n=1 Tax=Centruroides sculpturatus TaxID=218467 RepID=UPI000C6E1BEE|nr:uncharacterized protein LOC111616274 [Centruroides sculpturatus]